MVNATFVIGLDFGTKSVRALVVDARSGRELGSAVSEYEHGVIDERLPGVATRLDPDWALQNPRDYIEALKQVIPEALDRSGVAARDIRGLGIDFTSATIVPALADGTPLCSRDEWRARPHAWVKLWKHHAAQPEADRINALASERGELWLPNYGGKITSEFLQCKALQILEEDPKVYAAINQLIEAGDWLTWQLTGVLQRNACAAGHRALWRGADGYPGREFMRALDPRFADLDDKLRGPVVLQGSYVGGLKERGAQWTGLPVNTPVAAAMMDAHAALLGAGVTQPGCMVMILGTSTVHMMIDRDKHCVPGICGVIRDGMLPGWHAYEAGQTGVGDIFEWFMEHGVPAEYYREAQARGVHVFQVLEENAAQQEPGEHGLLALDWWNGNRSVLADADLGGVLVGASLGTRPPDIYRALIEATAFGTKTIIDTLEANGTSVRELIACGGLAERNPLLMQIYADVTGRVIQLSASKETLGLGAAMLAATAAGVYDSVVTAVEHMAQIPQKAYQPICENHAIYQQLFAEYRRLHDYFGRETPVMKNLRRIRQKARSKNRP